MQPEPWRARSDELTLQMRVFAIAREGDDATTEERNRFLRSQKALRVKQVAVIDKSRH